MAFLEIDNDLLLTQERKQDIFLNQRIYKKFIDKDLWLNIILLVSIISSLRLFNSGSYEYENKMNQIFLTTDINFKSINSNKIKLIITQTFLLTLILTIFLLI